jgi:NDP-sugar pyrophosphorylase family protein
VRCTLNKLVPGIITSEDEYKYTFGRNGIYFYESPTINPSLMSDRIGVFSVILKCEKEHISPNITYLNEQTDFLEYWSHVSDTHAVTAYADHLGRRISGTYVTREEYAQGVNYIDSFGDSGVLRSLEVGAYILDGYWMPYENNWDYVYFNHSLVIVDKNDSTSYIQQFILDDKIIRYFTITDDSYTSEDIELTQGQGGGGSGGSVTIDETLSISGAAADAKATGDKIKEMTPVKGTDYWTETDIAEIKAYVDEAILGGAW